MALNTRINYIIGLLAKQDGVPVRVPFLAEKAGVSERTIRNDLDLINDELADLEDVTLMRKPSVGVWIDGPVDKLKNLHQKHEDGYTERFHSQEKRVEWTLFKLFASKDPVLFKEIELTLKVSHSSIQRDFELVKEHLLSKNLTLKRKHSEGLWVDGDEWVIREELFEIIEPLVKAFDGHDAAKFELPRIYRESIAGYEAFMEYVPAILSLMDSASPQFTLKSTKNILVYLLVVWIRKFNGERLEMDSNKATLFDSTNKDFKALAQSIFKLFNENAPALDEKERDYILLHLISARYTARFDTTTTNLKEHEVVSRMIMVASSFMAIDFTDDPLLERGLLNHLHSMRYRIEYGIPIEEPEAIQMEKYYPGIKAATMAAIQVVETFFKIKIPEKEFIYIEIYFGAAIERQEPKVHTRDLKTVIICEAGLGSSQILNERLKRFLPNLKIERISNRNDALSEGNEGIDFYITTVPLKKDFTDKPVISVQPIPDYTDILTIQSLMTEILSTQKVKTASYSEDIIAIAKKYGLNHEAFNQEITEYLEKTGIQAHKTKASNEKDSDGLLDLLGKDHIAITDDAMDWEQATRRSIGLLESKGHVGPEYKEAVIENIHKNGPYMVIANHVALLHEKPEQGVLKTSMALLVSEKGVAFNKKPFDPVHLIFAFSTEDDHSHLRALSELLSVIDKADNVRALKTKTSAEAILEFLDSKVPDDLRGDIL
ncbi:MAG: BglG family transcription antiterminator [Bacillota bacterium]